jgi:hypothetical protein
MGEPDLIEHDLIRHDLIEDDLVKPMVDLSICWLTEQSCWT